MRYILLLIILSLFSASECRNKRDKTPVINENRVPADSLPLCIRKLLDEKNKETPPNPPVKMEEYFYNDKPVYLITAQCCDFFNAVYDQNCTIICAPSGGITGKGDGKCEDFLKTARYVKEIRINEKNK